MSQDVPAAPGLARQMAAEWLGVALIVFLGSAVAAAKIFAGADFGLWDIGLAWGTAVGLAILVTAPVSGAHLNPAVTLVMWRYGRSPGRLVLPFILAQTAGGASGAALALLIYRPLWQQYLADRHIVWGSSEMVQAAAAFTTFPHPLLGTLAALIVEAVITAILVVVIMACGNDRATRQLLPVPVVVGLVVAIIGAATGPMTGFALNPARDLGPRMMLWMAGWGDTVMTAGRDIPYVWIPICGPIIGAFMGAAFYQHLIGRHLDAMTSTART